MAPDSPRRNRLERSSQVERRRGEPNASTLPSDEGAHPLLLQCRWCSRRRHQSSELSLSNDQRRVLTCTTVADHRQHLRHQDSCPRSELGDASLASRPELGQLVPRSPAASRLQSCLEEGSTTSCTLIWIASLEKRADLSRSDRCSPFTCSSIRLSSYCTVPCRSLSLRKLHPS